MLKLHLGTAFGIGVLALVEACGQSAGDESGGSGGVPTLAGGSASVNGGAASVSVAGASVAASGAPALAAGAGGSSAGNGSMSYAGASGRAATSAGGTAGSATSAGGSPSGAAGSSASAGGGAGGPPSSGAKPFKGVANSPCAARTALNVSWYYNWMQNENEPCTDGKGGEFVPMIWGHTGAEQTDAGIRSAIAGMVKKGYHYVLGFNEPDNTGQSNLSTATAISLLPGFDDPTLKVGTPATQANTSGQTWFKDYMAKVAADTSLRNDFIAIHWYGWNAGSCDASAKELESYIKYAEGFPGNRPIWLTEWSCLHDSAPTAAGVLAFYKGALAVFAKHPRLERYAWYPWTTNCELNQDSGALTPLGVEFAAAPAVKSAP